MLEFADPLLKGIIQVSFCCADRQGDVLKIMHHQLQKDGLFIQQGKTGKAQIKCWTPRLKAAIAQGNDSGLQNVRYVFTNKHGVLITENVLRHWYRAAKDQAAQAYPKLVLDSTFHDIKAKSISDYEKGDEQEFSRHTTKSQMENYNRETSIVDSHD